MGLEEEREVDLVVGLRRGFGRREKVVSKNEEGIVVSDKVRMRLYFFFFWGLCLKRFFYKYLE